MLPGVAKLVVQQREKRMGPQPPAPGARVEIPAQADGQGAHREAAQGRGRIVDAVDSPRLHDEVAGLGAEGAFGHQGAAPRGRPVVAAPAFMGLPYRDQGGPRTGRIVFGILRDRAGSWPQGRQANSRCRKLRLRSLRLRSRARSIRTRPELIRRHCDAAVSARRQRATSRSSSEYRRNWSGAAPTTW